MKQIPSELKSLYDALLVQKEIPEKLHFYYRKWLKYYLDFCQKYDFQSDKGSLSHFITKLKDKKQTVQQQKQASHAVSIYYEIESTESPKKDTFKDKNGIILRKKEDPKSTHANWIQVYNGLNSEIKTRHYSPKTLKAYTGWVGQFQNYNKAGRP